jgi:hypothetical protein
MKIKAYIKKHGVTKIPGYGDPEFAALHRRRMREYDHASAREKAAMLASGVIP